MNSGVRRYLFPNLQLENFELWIYWYLTPLSTLFHLYRDDQSLLVEESGAPDETNTIM